MPGALHVYQGPAGGGKGRLARLDLREGLIEVVSDVTAIWVALNGLQRDSNGRYPVREKDDPTLALAIYIQAAIVRQGLREDLVVGVTTSSRAGILRWQQVAEEYRAPLTALTVDPGRSAVVKRLSVNGILSPECAESIARWYD